MTLEATRRPDATDVPAVRVEGIEKYFGDRVVLNDVTLSVGAGETVVLLGPSGCGKSTLCRTMIGLEPFNQGAVDIRGERYLTAAGGKVKRGKNARRAALSMGMVFQQFTLFPSMTALQNVALAPQKVLGLSAAEARERATECLAAVGMEPHSHKFPAHLSGGQQQRAAIARELAMRRSIFFFDEVTSALDPELVREVLEVMDTLAAQTGTAMVVVTHEMAFARKVADRIVFMDNGSVVEQAPPEAFFDSPQSPRAQRFLDRSIGYADE